MRILVLFVALCALTTAMVPRDRRAVDPDDPAHTTTPSSATTTKTICAPWTPCGWSVMKPQVKVIDVNITNTYCECAVGTICQIDEEDVHNNYYIQHCIPPMEEDDSG